MTYCVGILLASGMVMLSDSRTNAGVDHINTFRKMSRFERPGERCLVLMTAGNLAITQAVVSVLREAECAGDGRTSLLTAENMFEAARHVGDTLRAVYARDAESLSAFGIDFNASLILGGQIAGDPPRLFSIYAAGNFIEATRETPYFQIGESKYGKPILDRVLRWDTSLDEAAKCALISMDSTIRSNLSVGLPLDLVTMEANVLALRSQVLVDADNAYFSMVRNRWGSALRDAFDAIPNPDVGLS
ncbi:MAG: proteasome-type protease [Rhodocyclaceae bacterium]|nr:proteasome-type protease [Rhodocyclaceae bacterium]